MSIAKIVKFIWSRTGFLPEPEPVYFAEAEVVVVAPSDSDEILVRVVDPEKRIWATLGLTHGEAECLAGQLQLALAVQES
ncbi:MAG: hypothetical protein Q7U97_03090 [Rhodocyclaceae bacterium]|nr:hypothetical protein [Rhodocyclaceae bacterium]